MYYRDKKTKTEKKPVSVRTCATFTQLPRRACGIAVWRIAIWRIAPLTMARRAHDVRRTHDVRRALDVNENGTRMRNCVIVYARVCMICTCACMAPLRMCPVLPPGCRLCGAYAVAVGVITHELVVARSTG